HRPRAPALPRDGRVQERALRWHLELAGPRVAPRQLPPHRVVAEVPLLLRRHSQGRVPDWVRGTAEPLAGRRRALAAAHPDLSARQGRAPAGLRRDGNAPAGPPLARPGSLPRILPRRQRRRRGREPPAGLDGPRRQAPAAEPPVTPTQGGG